MFQTTNQKQDETGSSDMETLETGELIDADRVSDKV